MTTRTWDPLVEMEALRHEVDRMFEGLGLGSWTRPFSRVAFLPGISARAYPMLNMSEDHDNVYVEALAPGLNPDTLEITVLDATLRIAGEKAQISADVGPDAFHRSERGAGRFVRTIELPVRVDFGRAKAEYRNGLLLLTMPKAEEAKPRQIPITVR